MSASYFTFQSPTRVNFNSEIWSRSRQHVSAFTANAPCSRQHVSALSANAPYSRQHMEIAMFFRWNVIFIYERSLQYLVPELRYPCHGCHPCRCRRPYRCPPLHRHHHHHADTLNVRDVLTKTPYLYLVPKLRYPCHYCRHPCHCPPPRRHPPYHRHHHHHHLKSWGNTRRKSSQKPHISI